MYVEKMMSIGGLPLEDYPFGREVHLEGFLLEHLGHICPSGTEPSGLEPTNQVPVAGGGAASGADGRVDIVFELAAETDGVWALVEIKAGRLTVQHLNQLLAYLAASSELTREIQQRYGTTVEPKAWMGVLVGTSIEPDLAATLVKGEWHLLPGVSPLAGAKPELSAVVIKRFRDAASKAVYVLADKYFNTKASNSRDYSRFSFDAGTTWYGAAAFVREYVRWHLGSMHLTSVAELQAAFPKTLQGSLPVIEEVQNVTDRRRYSSEVFTIGLQRFMVCNQWGYAHGEGNLVRFIRQVKAAGATVQRRAADGIRSVL